MAPPQFPFSSLRWGVFNGPGPIWARDFSYAEYGVRREDSFVIATRSMERPELPDLQASHK